MRAYSANFDVLNLALRKETRWVVEQSFDLADTDLHYFTSHNDCEVPIGTPEANIHRSVLRAPVVTSQKLNVRKAASSIGSLSFDLMDKSSAITNLLYAKLDTPELILDGTFVSACGVNWVCGAGWSISGNKATHTTASSTIDYAVSFAPNREYLVQYTISGRTTGTVTPRFGGGTAVLGTARSLDGLYTEVITSDAANTLMTFQASTTFNGSVSLVSLRRLNGDGIRHKRVRIYRGYRGLAWADYQIPPGGTQIIDGNIVAHRGKYTFNARDRQRSSKKKIFDLKTTNLTSAYIAGDTTLNVTSTTGFEMVAHGTSFSDLPSTTAGYVEIDDVAFSYTGVTATTFTGVLGGRLGTRDSNIDVDATTQADRRPEVKEVIYLEMPGPKMAYAVYTNSLYGQAASTPAHWGLGISSAHIATSQFTSIGVDLWDPTDDTKGKVLRFDSLKRRDAKKFIQEQIYLPLGLYVTVLADGQLGVKRMHRVLSDASTVATLDNTNVLSYTALTHDQDALSNLYTINWNWERSRGATTRTNGYIDTGSKATYQEGTENAFTFEGMHGSLTTASLIHNTFDSLRDRYSGPPERISVDLHQAMNGVEIGDVVWVDLNQRDYVGGTTLQRAFEVQGYRDTGTRIVLTLFGSSQEPGILRSTTASTVLNTAFYNTGLVAANKLDAVAGLTTSLSGGILHITASSAPSVDLPGSADGTSTAVVYWYPGVVQIDAGVTVWADLNIQIRCYDLVINGVLTSNGKGHAGATAGGGTDFNLGTKGILGSTESGGGLRAWTRSGGGWRCYNRLGGSVVGVWPVLPVPTIAHDGTSVAGIWPDLRGTSGSSGGSSYRTKYGSAENPDGGNGGGGGGGIIIVARSVTTGISGYIDVGGAAGSLASDVNATHAGSGAGGAPGGVLILLDGNGLATVTIRASQGDTPLPAGSRLPKKGLPVIDRGNSVFDFIQGFGTPYHSFYEGAPVTEHNISHLQIYPIPPNETAVADESPLTDPPTAIAIVEATASKNTMNIVYLEISVTAPSATNYRGSMIYIRQNGTNAWSQVGEATGTDEVVVPVAADGTTYNFKAHPVSIQGVESKEFFGPTSYTVATTQVAVIGTNNALATSTTVGAGTNGEGIKVESTGIGGYDTGGVAKFFLDAVTGILTASSAVISGAITATSGVIGGWTITTNAISKGNVTLDASNTRIQAGPNSGDYVRIDTNGIVGVDSTLGTTFSLPTNGDAPVFASGIINSTVFNVTSAGILETSSTAGDGTASGQGVRINDLGIQGWAASDATAKFKLDAVTGILTAVSFVTENGTGKRIEVNPSGDNELHFYGDRGDGTVEELATMGISTIGSDTVIGNFGSIAAGHSNVAVYAKSNNNRAVYGYSTSNSGIYGRSSTQHGVHGFSSSGRGVFGDSTNDVGVYASSSASYGLDATSVSGYGARLTGSSLGPVLLTPSSSSSAPTHTAATGTLWVTSAGVLYINTSGSTTWAKVGAQ